MKPTNQQPVQHWFIPSYSDPARCGQIVKGVKWSIGDPYYCCRRPAADHLVPAFIPITAVVRKDATAWGDLHHRLIAMGHLGLLLCWKLTRKPGDPEYPPIDPAIVWCGRGRDPRPWRVRLAVWCWRTRIWRALDFRFGPLRFPR